MGLGHVCHSVKHLSYKFKDLCLIPQTQIKRQAWCSALIISPLGRQKQEDSKACAWSV